jgi:hypothetical protein
LPKKMVIERDIFILGLSSAAVSHYNSEIWVASSEPELSLQ